MTEKKFKYDLSKPFYGLPFNDIQKMVKGTWMYDEELKTKLDVIDKELIRIGRRKEKQ